MRFQCQTTSGAAATTEGGGDAASTPSLATASALTTSASTTSTSLSLTPALKAVCTGARRKETRIATNGAVSEDPGVGDLLEKKNGEKVVKASSSLVVAALRGVANKNQGIRAVNLTPKGILLGLTKNMHLMDPFYIRQQTTVMVEIGVCKGKKGNSSEVYKFYGQTEDEAALAAIKFLQSVLFEISDINRAKKEKYHCEVEEIKVVSAGDGKEVNKLLDREEVLLMKCKGIIDSAIEEIEARQREFN